MHRLVEVYNKCIGSRYVDTVLYRNIYEENYERRFFSDAVAGFDWIIF